MENNTAGSGGALGTFQTSDWQNNASGTPGTDEWNKGDNRLPIALGAKKVGKGKNRRVKFVIQRRPLNVKM